MLGKLPVMFVDEYDVDSSFMQKETRGLQGFRICTQSLGRERYPRRHEGYDPLFAVIAYLTVTQSDHPVLNSRYLLYEAQQAHYYGLDPALALLSVTSTPARAAGVGHRVGTIAEGL
jgi:imidazolonepropionase-like amidohydrolase